MPRIELRKCAVCGAEQRSDKQIWWGHYFGPVTLNFEKVPHIQKNLSLDMACLNCATSLMEVILEKIKQLAPVTTP